MKTLSTFALLFVCGVVIAGSPNDAPTVATVTRTIKQVDRRQGEAEWSAARKGDMLQSGDLIRTGEASLAIVKFLDNSMLQVREHSVLTLSGTKGDRTLSKDVRLTNGGVGFTISKQRPGEEFRFSSPTSVASIRGTSGFFASSDSSDTLTVLEGTIEFTNLRTHARVTVEAGYSAVAGTDGSIDQSPSTSEQRGEAEGAVKTGSTPKQLEIELRNGSGKARKLRLDYKD
jgi:hypothetical protein